MWQDGGDVFSSCADCVLDANDNIVFDRETYENPSDIVSCENNLEYRGRTGGTCADWANLNCGYDPKPFFLNSIQSLNLIDHFLFTSKHDNY